MPGGIVHGKGSSANGATHHHNLSVAVGLPSDGILLIIALCLHSVFLGIAIGVAETKPDAWKTLRTIFPHNIFAAVAMGIVLLRMMPNRPLSSCDAYAFAYAISSSIGMAIGIVIDPTTQGVVAGWSSAIFSGFCGMFIYVSVISYRYVQNVDSVDAFLATIVGFGIIVGLMIWDAFGYSAAVYLLWGKEKRTP
ncbi:zinc transporter 2-like [Eucalyptus grandis]|uniref:zinc transporter 2-like n=1 Tax=Eucalyptus grandis TaxID=71139 RepID=UPI00192E8C6E|nr:zinc transporter 2-like [Eucalyptus grandis]